MFILCENDLYLLQIWELSFVQAFRPDRCTRPKYSDARICAVASVASVQARYFTLDTFCSRSHGYKNKTNSCTKHKLSCAITVNLARIHRYISFIISTLWCCCAEEGWFKD